MTTPQEGMARLVAAAESGELDDLARRYGIRVITVFGSTGRGEPDPRDLDIGVLCEQDSPDVLNLWHELSQLTGVEVDLGMVNKGSALFRDRVLTRATPIWEAASGEWVKAAVDAAMTWMDVAWLARLDRERMARS